MKTEAQNYASMDPDDFSTGGGLFDDVDGVVTQAEFTDEAPEGYQAEGNPLFFVLGLLIDGADAPVTQSYAMGAKAGDNFAIGKDNGTLIPAGPASKINANSKFGTLMGSLKEEKFPMSTLGGPDGSMKNLVGTRAHFNRIADPERKGLKTGAKEAKYPPTTLLFTKIHALPGEKAATGKAAKGGTTKAAPAASKGAVDLTEAAEETLVAILSANDGSVQKAKLTLFATRELNGNPNKAGITKLITSDEFLARETAWSYDKSAAPVTVTLNA